LAPEATKPQPTLSSLAFPQQESMIESNVDYTPQHFRISFVTPNDKLSIENH
jgi:hypothetical protein